MKDVLIDGPGPAWLAVRTAETSRKAAQKSTCHRRAADGLKKVLHTHTVNGNRDGIMMVSQ